MPAPSRPRGGIPGEVLRLAGRLVGAGAVGVAGLVVAAFAMSFVVGLLSLLVRVVAGEEAARAILGVFPKVFGFLVFTGLLGLVLFTHGRPWRSVADAYGGTPVTPPLASRFPELVVISAGGLAFRRYVPLTLGIHARGISLTLAPGFSIGCPPIFLPFDELSVRPSSWYVWGKAWGIRAAKAKDVEIVLGDKPWEWLQAHCPAGTFHVDP